MNEIMWIFLHLIPIYRNMPSLISLSLSLSLSHTHIHSHIQHSTVQSRTKYKQKFKSNQKTKRTDQWSGLNHHASIFDPPYYRRDRMMLLYNRIFLGVFLLPSWQYQRSYRIKLGIWIEDSCERWWVLVVVVVEKKKQTIGLFMLFYAFLFEKRPP